MRVKPAIRDAICAALVLMLSAFVGAGITSTAFSQSVISSGKVTAEQQEEARKKAEQEKANFEANMALLADQEAAKSKARAAGTIFTVEAGPIRSTAHATELCPKICTANSATYTSQWWTTVKGKMSVCQCKANSEAASSGPLPRSR
jgi:cell division septation protein DedD